MKTTKKYLTILLALVLAFSFVSCEMVTDKAFSDVVQEGTTDSGTTDTDGGNDSSSGESTPVAGTITVTITGLGDNDSVSVAISDASGTEVGTKALSSTDSAYTTAELPAGTYSISYTPTITSSTQKTFTYSADSVTVNGNVSASAVLADLVISTADDLVTFLNEVAAETSEYSASVVALGSDIDLSNAGTITYTSTGTFTGTFDGNGKTISNLTLEGNVWRLGIFCGLNGTVQNLILTGASVTNNYSTDESSTGIIAGNADGVSISNITITNSSVVNPYYGLNVKVGGLVGDAWNYNNLKFENCHLTDVAVESLCMAGGIAGSVNSGVTISDCSVTLTKASIFAKNNKNTSYRSIAGGITAYLNSSTIENCSVSISGEGSIKYEGTDTNGYSSAAGICAMASVNTSTSITNCSVINDRTSGGLLNNGTESTYYIVAKSTSTRTDIADFDVSTCTYNGNVVNPGAN